MEVTIDLKTIINKLQATFDRIQKLEEELIQYKEAARSEAELVNELLEENNKLVEALKFYAEISGLDDCKASQVLKEIGRKW